MMMGVVAFGDDAVFVFSRTAEADGDQCADTYRVTIE